MLVTVGFERYVDLLLDRMKLQILEGNLLDETDGWKAALKHFNEDESRTTLRQSITCKV